MVFKVEIISVVSLSEYSSRILSGAFDGVGCKTVIPRHVIGKFSIRIVPNMQISTLEKLVEKHVQQVMKDRQSPNKISVKLEHGGNYWVADPNNPQYVAARKATVAVHGIEPDFTREGGSIPITCKCHSFLRLKMINFISL